MRPSFGCDRLHVPPWDDRNPWCEDDDTLLREAEDLDSLAATTWANCRSLAKARKTDELKDLYSLRSAV